MAGFDYVYGLGYICLEFLFRKMPPAYLDQYQRVINADLINLIYLHNKLKSCMDNRGSLKASQ